VIFFLQNSARSLYNLNMKGETKANVSMTCEKCDARCQRFGTHRNGLRRFRCPQCHKTYTEPHRLTLGEMYISEEKMLIALKLLLEGNSIRSTMRITGVDGNTIMKALALAGERCEKLMGRLIVNVPVTDVQADEIWGYVAKKEAHKLPAEKDDDSKGDAYCYVAMERHSKLVLNFALGRRNNAGVVTLKGNWIYKVQISVKFAYSPGDPKATPPVLPVVEKVRIQAAGEVVHNNGGKLKAYFRGYDKVVLQNLFQDLQAKLGPR
jgi:transposase-like protein